jgi:hypothetical protein
MSRRHSEALKRRWQNAAYREKQLKELRRASQLAVLVTKGRRRKNGVSDDRRA